MKRRYARYNGNDGNGSDNGDDDVGTTIDFVMTGVAENFSISQ